MFEEGKQKNLKEAPPLSDKVVRRMQPMLQGLSVPELIATRDAIDRLLPPLALKDVNMEEQALLQFYTIRALQADTLEAEEHALNQRVSLANSVASSLTRLSDMQKELYTSERFKKIENLMVRTLLKLPESVAKAFLDEYEKTLEQYVG